MQDDEGVSLLIFRAISGFVSELGNLFSKNSKPLALYARLVTKTNFLNDESIKRHISAFTRFCSMNRESIRNKNKNLSEPKITYSERIYIDMNLIFSLIKDDRETETTVWEHIYTISALVDPESGTKNMLVEREEGGEGEKELIENIVSKLQNHVKPGSNPMEVMSNIMNSGLMNELINDMNEGFSNGKLDFTRLVGMVQGMASSVDTSSNPLAGGMLNNLTGMLSNMKPE